MDELCEALQDADEYYFDRDDMCSVFDCKFMNWLYDRVNCESYDFAIQQRGDDFYIIHYPSLTIINWYKHMGRCNACNKDLSLDDLRQFKKLLIEDFECMEGRGKSEI